jgi:DNA polymerase-1
MKKPTTAILDGDILVYRAAFWADGDGIEDLPYRIKLDVTNWIPDGVDKVIVALSCPREKNYRRNFWPHYKIHRDSVKKPDCMDYTIECIYETGHTCRCVDSLEADDLIGMLVSSGMAIGVTIDKDLRQIPGWHWNPDKEDEPVEITQEEGDAFFYQQWLSGDSTDNIWGLWRVGPKKANKYLKDEERADWDDFVLDLYENEDWDKRPENRTPDMTRQDFALSQARCVRILRHGDYNKETGEVVLWTPHQ